MTEIKQQKSDWENAYENGEWQRLHGHQEFARYTLVAGYVQKTGQPVSLLDLGCGEGVILKHLNLDLIAKYTGVDLAQKALDRIAPKRSQDRRVCSSLENFSPDEKWDVILFNEVLYYTFDPVAQLKKFENALTPGGWFVISMYRKSNPLAYNNRCIRKVRRYLENAHYRIEDAVELSKTGGSTGWQISVARPTA